MKHKKIGYNIGILFAFSIIYILARLFLQELVVYFPALFLNPLLLLILSSVIYSSLLLLLLYNLSGQGKKEKALDSILLAISVAVELFFINLVTGNIHSVSDITSIPITIPFLISGIVSIVLISRRNELKWKTRNDQKNEK